VLRAAGNKHDAAGANGRDKPVHNDDAVAGRNRDQLVTVAAGNGVIVVDGLITAVGPGSVVLIPGGAQHDVRNTHPTEPLRLVVVYAPPKFAPDAVMDREDI